MAAALLRPSWRRRRAGGTQHQQASWKDGGAGGGGEAPAPIDGDGSEVDRSSGCGQWKVLLQTMGARSCLVVGAGLALSTLCLLCWQLVTQKWCAGRRGGAAGWPCECPAPSHAARACLPGRRMHCKVRPGRPRCTARRPPGPQPTHPHPPLAPRLDRYAAGLNSNPWRLASLIFGFGTALFSTLAVLGQTRALIGGATRALRAALAGVYAAPYAFYQARLQAEPARARAGGAPGARSRVSAPELGCRRWCCEAAAAPALQGGCHGR